MSDTTEPNVTDLHRSEKTGFYEVRTLLVRDNPCSLESLEYIRAAAWDRWADSGVDWKTITQWLREGCPKPVSGVLLHPEAQPDPIGPAFGLIETCRLFQPR